MEERMTATKEQGKSRITATEDEVTLVEAGRNVDRVRTAIARANEDRSAAIKKINAKYDARVAALAVEMDSAMTVMRQVIARYAPEPK